MSKMSLQMTANPVWHSVLYSWQQWVLKG